MTKKADQAAEVCRKILADDEVRGQWLFFAYVILKRLDLQHPIRDHVKEALAADLARRDKSFTFAEGEEEPELLWTLVDCIKAKLPEIYHVFGEHAWPYHQFTLAVLGAWAPAGETKEALFQAARAATPRSAEIEHFPYNPLTIKTDPLTGEERLAGWEKATVQHFMEMKSYDRARKPAQPAGRPKGLPKPKKSGRPQVDPELDLRVYQAKLDGMDWKQIARRVLGIKIIPTDPKARERLRDTVRRNSTRGRKIFTKKTNSD